MTGPKKDFNSLQTGAALLEFALVLPLLLLLVLGISEFSFAFFHLNTLNKSVQDGALYFSDVARCNSATDCSPVYPINWSCAGTNSVNCNNAVNLVKTGYKDKGACDNVTNPPLMPGCANYINSSTWITSPDANHIMVTATYRHVFMMGNALSNLTTWMFGSASIPVSYNLTASSVMRAQ